MQQGIPWDTELSFHPGVEWQGNRIILKVLPSL